MLPSGEISLQIAIGRTSYLNVDMGNLLLLNPMISLIQNTYLASFASPSTYQAQSTSNVEGLTFQAFGYCLANESENRGGSSGSVVRAINKNNNIFLIFFHLY